MYVELQLRRIKGTTDTKEKAKASENAAVEEANLKKAQKPAISGAALSPGNRQPAPGNQIQATSCRQPDTGD